MGVSLSEWGENGSHIVTSSSGRTGNRAYLFTIRAGISEKGVCRIGGIGTNVTTNVQSCGWMGVDGYGHFVRQTLANIDAYEFAWKALEGLLVEGEGFEPSNS